MSISVKVLRLQKCLPERTIHVLYAAPIYHEEGSFKTMDEGEEGLFDVILDDPRRQAIKIFRDGQIFILRGEKVYSVTGQEVK